MRDQIPAHVVGSLQSPALKLAMREWMAADRIDPFQDIAGFELQPHENGRDWVLLVNMADGLRTRVFPIEFPVLH